MLCRCLYPIPRHPNLKSVFFLATCIRQKKDIYSKECLLTKAICASATNKQKNYERFPQNY